MTDNPTTPAGWYADPTTPGTERYWNGVAWTDHHRPVAAAPTPAPAPPSPYGSPAPSVAGSGKPDNYLVWTILSTLLCCLPIGAVGIYFSTQVDKLWAAGDVAGAQDRARSARNFAIASAAVSLALAVGWIVFVILFGTFSIGVST